jgi:uncharacterized protein YcbK (DUF882 family)
LPALKPIDAIRLAKSAYARALFAPLLLCLGLASNSTESAIANGETRTITLSDGHTNESGSFAYMVNGVYDSSVLEKLNWFMRDWRHDEKTSMDPRMFDIVWEVYRESGSTQPVDVLSGYRSPETNAMLRRRSRQVAEHSQHMLGKAMDAHFVDVPTSKIRDIAMRLQAGGVGFYPTGNTPWVHIDSGSVRYWPRMSHDQIARLFPDGKTVFIPADGQPLSGYQQAAAEIEARGGAVYAATAEAGGSKSLFAMLFGGEDDAEEGGGSHGRGGDMTMASAAMPTAAGRSGGGAQSFFLAQNQLASGAPDAISKAKRDLPHGETYMKAPDAPPAVAAAEPTEQKPVVVASADQSVAIEPGVQHGGAPTLVPLPPQRPSEFLASDFGGATAPLPPTRPVEFASLQTAALDGPVTRSLSPIASETARKNDLIAALLARKLPSVITKGAGGSVPFGALALAEVQAAPEPPERPATLAKAAALSAPLPPSGSLKLPPLARAAMLSTPLLGSHAAKKPLLVAAKIDRSDFSVMTAAPAKTPNPVDDSARMAPVLPSPHSDALMAMLTPSVEAPAAFAPRPYGDLRADAFTGPAVKAPDESMTAALRGAAN